MADMGFNPHDIRKSLLNRLFDEPMATYGLLQCQARQQGDFARQTKAVQPGITPFPTPTDTATFPWCQKRTTDVPALRVFLSLSLTTNSAEDSQQVGRRLRRSVTVPLIDPHCLEKGTPTHAFPHTDSWTPYGLTHGPHTDSRTPYGHSTVELQAQSEVLSGTGRGGQGGLGPVS